MDKKTIGIIGGGQLGRMLAESAHKLGFKVIVLDPTSSSPAGQVADEQIVGSFKDKNKIVELAERCDYLTYEIEGVNIEGLEEIEKLGKPLNPSSKILKIIKDKFAQKEFLEANEIPVAPFAIIHEEKDAKMQGILWGYPYLLKARFDAYDGRGNYVLNNPIEISTAFATLSKSPLYAEKFVSFKNELAVILTRSSKGEIVIFEPVETIHKNNICHVVMHPAPMDIKIKDMAKDLAVKIISRLGGVGTFAVEMFLTNENEILVNEIAPRVHNSGHHTIEAYTASQFEEHIRAISGMPLVVPEATSGAAVMVNILGERDGVAQFADKNPKNSSNGVAVHLYGKMETRKERKMGHITVLGDNLKKVRAKAENFKKNISI